MAAGANQASVTDWDFWSQGLARSFFNRMYIRTLQIGAVITMLFLAFDQKHVALGLLSGLAVGLFTVWTAEATVKLLFNGGGFAGVKLAVAAILKMPVLVGALLGISWAAFNGYMNIFGVVGGVLVAHGTMLTMVIATAIASQDSNRERYR